MIRLTLVLALITCCAAVALGFVYQSTAPKIDEQKRITEEMARRNALPEAACGVFVLTEADGFEYHSGYRNADTTGFVGYVVKASGKGYSSTIETTVGVDPTGRITGLKVTSQQETPGLGTKIVEVKSNKTVLDAIKEAAGRGKPPTVPVDLVEADGSVRCVLVELRDEDVCGGLETLVASRDTAGVVSMAGHALGMSPPDSADVFSDPARVFDLADQVLNEVRAGATPWFLRQFVGKRHGSLVVVSEQTDTYIQAITGATISSVAVNESVQKSLKQLEAAVGGFEEE
jgi:RnfABCDGE-type electron transport complex G subunit